MDCELEIFCPYCDYSLGDCSINKTVKIKCPECGKIYLVKVDYIPRVSIEKIESEVKDAPKL